MYNIQSTTEGQWNKVNKIVLTEAQKELLSSSENLQAKQELLQELELAKLTPLSQTESEKYIELYLKHKPVLKVNDEYQLISCNITIYRKTSGIINCRVNGEHKQIRF
jgi:hypothetical protein